MHNALVFGVCFVGRFKDDKSNTHFSLIHFTKNAEPRALPKSDGPAKEKKEKGKASAKPPAKVVIGAGSILGFFGKK